MELANRTCRCPDLIGSVWQAAGAASITPQGIRGKVKRLALQPTTRTGQNVMLLVVLNSKDHTSI